MLSENIRDPRANDILIRAGVPDDASALAELAARTFRETFAADNREEDIALHEAESYGTSLQEQELRDPNIITLLVESNEVLIAFAQVRFAAPPSCVTGDAPAEVWRFYIAPEWHGRGIAQQLMRRVESEAQQRGARTLWLGVWERNERAKAFYNRNGFADVGTHVYMVGTDAQTDRIMVRSMVK